MAKRIFLLFFLFTRLLSTCDTPVNQPLPDITPTQTLTSTSQVEERSKISPTGFYWPTGVDPETIKTYMYGYMGSGCNGSKTYTQGLYHTGIDIPAEYDSPVVAIADGIVVDVSSGGWNLGDSKLNSGVIIKHFLSDGTPFIAIYGHIHTEFKRGQTYPPVKAGEKIGTIGDWGDADHLHLTISKDIPAKAPYGRPLCPENGTELSLNGTASPIEWLNKKYPGSYSGPAILASGGDETNEWPSISSTIISATVVPDPEASELSTFAFGYNLELLLTYDSNTWTKKLWGKSLNTIDWPREAFDALEVLELNDLPGCTVHHSIGMGPPQTWTRSISQETIGSYNFRVEQWTDTNTNRIILVTYNVDEKNLYVAIEPGSETNSCFDIKKQRSEFVILNNQKSYSTKKLK